MAIPPPPFQAHLRAGSAGAVGLDYAVLAEVRSWLLSLSADELLRVDSLARQRDWCGSPLAPPAAWALDVLLQPDTTPAFLASLHPDGYVRERAVRALGAVDDPLADLALAMRAADHVPAIREWARQRLLERTRLASVARILPVLERLETRDRVGHLRRDYLDRAAEQVGTEHLWSALRQSVDRRTRRRAVAESVSRGLVTLSEARDLLPREQDRAIRRQLSELVADTGSAAMIAESLVRSRYADCRALGLVRLSASELDAAMVEPLLADSSVLVRWWAQRRWRELGHDPVTASAATARGEGPARVRARAYDGMLEAGGSIDLAEARSLVSEPVSRLRQVGLRVLTTYAEPADVPLLREIVRVGTTKEARLATVALLRLRSSWSITDLDPIKTSPDPTVRRRAWTLQRSLGDWEAVLVDLELRLYPDPAMGDARRPLRAPAYGRPSREQAARLRTLLARVTLPGEVERTLTFAAGLSV